jgi:hypothetical protein
MGSRSLDHAGALQTHKCTRTRPLSDTGEDVRFLDNLTRGRPQALVNGDVFRRLCSPTGARRVRPSLNRSRLSP